MFSLALRRIVFDETMSQNYGPEYFEHEGAPEFDPTSPELLDDLEDFDPLEEDDE